MNHLTPEELWQEFMIVAGGKHYQQWMDKERFVEAVTYGRSQDAVELQSCREQLFLAHDEMNTNYLPAIARLQDRVRVLEEALTFIQRWNSNEVNLETSLNTFIDAALAESQPCSEP